LFGIKRVSVVHCIQTNIAWLSHIDGKVSH